MGAALPSALAPASLCQYRTASPTKPPGLTRLAFRPHARHPCCADTCSNSIRVVKTTKQTATTPLTYTEAVKVRCPLLSPPTSTPPPPPPSPGSSCCKPLVGLHPHSWRCLQGQHRLVEVAWGARPPGAAVCTLLLSTGLAQPRQRLCRFTPTSFLLYSACSW